MKVLFGDFWRYVCGGRLGGIKVLSTCYHSVVVSLPFTCQVVTLTPIFYISGNCPLLLVLVSGAAGLAQQDS